MEKDDCWLWGSGNGYKTTTWFGKHMYVHRLAHELAIGPIPDGFTVDHVAKRGCKYRNCFNPAHLEAVSHQTNLLRAPTTRTAINAAKTHCLRGHPFDEENTHWMTTSRGTPGRSCRRCHREREAARREKTRIPRVPKTHCKHGHPFSGSNLITHKNGKRACRACSQEAKRRFRERQKAGVS